jgi:hypothetical protein
LSSSPEHPGDATHVAQSTQALRETTKWIFAAGAGLAATLVAGVNFSQLSDLAPSSAGFVIVFVAVIVGFATLVVVLGMAATVLTQSHPTLRNVLRVIDLGAEDRATRALRQAFKEEGDYLFATDARNLNHLWHQVRERNRLARQGLLAPSLEEPGLAMAEGRVVDFADFFLTRERFRRLLRAIAVAVPVLIAAGIVVEQVPKDPTESMTTLLTAAKLQILDPSLLRTIQHRTACSQPPLDQAVIVGAYNGASDIRVNLPTTPGCKAVSFRANVDRLYIEKRA